MGQAVYGDGRYYWANAHSIFFDHDLNLDNQLKHQWNPQNNNLQSPVENRHPEPYLGHPLGTGLFWLPGMAIADLLAHGNGYGDIYQITIGLSVIGMVSLAFYLLGKKIHWLAISFLWLTTNLFYYSSIDILNSHPISFFLASIFLYLFLTWKKSMGQKKFLVMGILIGLTVSVREQDFLTLLPLISYLFLSHAWQVKAGLALMAGVVIGYSPELYFRIVYGAGPLSPWLGPSMWQLGQSKFLNLFTDARRGIVLYSPSILLALAGLGWSKEKWYRLALISFLLQLLLISVWWAWDQGESYGIRMLLSTYPFLAFGFEAVTITAGKFFARSSLIKLLIVLTIFNFLMILRFLLSGTGINGGGVDPTTQERIDTLLRFGGRFWSS